MNLRKLCFPLLLLNASLIAHGQVLTTSQNNNLNVNVTNTSSTFAQAISSSQCDTATLNGAGSVNVWITSNTATGGSLFLQSSGDGVTWGSATLYPDPQGSGVGVTSITVPVAAFSSWSGNLAGITAFRVCGSPVSGGTVNVQVTASAAALVSPGPALDASGNAKASCTITPSGASANGTSAIFINNTGAINSIKTLPGNLYGWHVTNNSTTAAVYLEFWNLSSGVVLGTTAPTYAWVCPMNAQCFITLNAPIGFSNGIIYAATTAINGPTTGSTTGVIEYK